MMLQMIINKLNSTVHHLQNTLNFICKKSETNTFIINMLKRVPHRKTEETEMATNLVIVESPAKAKTIERYLGKSIK